MKNNFLSLLTDGICVILLSVCPLFCLSSSFSINFSAPLLIISAFIFSTIFYLLSEAIDNNLKYALCMTVIAFVIFLVIIFSYEALLSQVNYAVNKVLEQYSQYIPVSNKIFFSKYNSTDATGVFILINAIISGVFSFLITKLKSIKIVALLTILLLFPCFVLVNTLPNIVPLLTIFTVLFALYFSSQTRRLNYSHSGIATIVSAVILAITITVVALLNPIADYKRPKWQNNLLSNIESITGIKSNNESGKITSALGTVGNTLEPEVDFSTIGELKQTSTTVMTVTSNKSGRLYLKGMTYANYKNNKWSVLSDEQAEAFLEDYQVFLMTTNDTSDDIVSINTAKKEGIIYTPYFLTSLNENFSPICDAFIANNDKQTSYTMQTTLYDENDLHSFYRNQTEINEKAYNSYVNENYLKIPYDTKQAMLEIADNNGISEYPKTDIPTKVKEYISNSATYSLNTPKAPKDRDVAEWFLNDSDTGYCMHFANATALMLRALDIPARYVSGYCVNLVDGKAVVTSDNAHAWVEYFDPEIGWIPLDATSTDFEVPQVTESTQTTTQLQATTPTVTQQATTPSTATPNKTYVSAKSYSSATTLIVIALLIGAVILRIIIIKIYRKYSFTHRDNKTKVICIYRYINKLSVHSKRKLPKQIEAICTKARFGNDTISNEEYNTVYKYSLHFRQNTMRKIPIFKKLYLIIIYGL